MNIDSKTWCKTRLIFILVFTPLISAPYSSNAQAFEYIDIGVQTTQPYLQDNSYANRWDLTQSYGASLTTPFYVGHVGLNVAYFDYEPKGEPYALLESTNYAATFGYIFGEEKIFSLSTMLGVGIQKTWLIGDAFTSNADERELYYTSILEPTIRLGKLALFAHFQYAKVFNYERQHILHLGLGVRYRLYLPNHIQSFID